MQMAGCTGFEGNNMRFSNYNILTRKLNNGGYVILNSLAGVLDLIDEEAYDLITSHSEDTSLTEEILNQMADVRDHFLERGFLTELSKEDEFAQAKEYALSLAKAEIELKDKAWGVVIVPNLGCNYRCIYCFEKAGGYPSLTMNRGQVDAIFDMIRDKVSPGENITLYGGEPLQKENRSLIEYIVRKGREIDCTFFAVTNGHDLEYYMDLLGSEGITSVQITLDGPKKIHDHRRISVDKSSSYEKVLANIKTVLSKTDVSIKLRINLDKRNEPFIFELLEELDKLGILLNPEVHIGVSPVMGIGNTTVKHEELSRLEESVVQKYPKLKESFLTRSMSSNEFILPALYFGQPVPRRGNSCIASSRMKVFSPDGKIYSCWSCLDNPDEAIGTYDEEGNTTWNQDVMDAWQKNMLAYKEDCLRCKYAFICAGGCFRPLLPGEQSAAEYECDYYRYMFADYIARVTDAYLAEENAEFL